MKKMGTASQKQDFQHALVRVLPGGWKEGVATWPRCRSLAQKCLPGPLRARGPGRAVPPATATPRWCPSAESALGKPGVFLASLGACVDVGQEWEWGWG